MKFIRALGRVILDFFAATGSVILFAIHAIIPQKGRNIYLKAVIKDMIEIGYYSLPVVGITSLFTGAVLALQSYTGFSRFSAEGAVATVVVLSVTRELGPVMAGLMVSGRVGAAFAAEIGTMKVTEQLDALKTLSTDPIKYLVTPKVIAATVMLPCLVLIADIIGIMGGYLVSVYALDFSPVPYLKSTFRFLETFDVVSGLIKACAFGFIISIIGCYNGFNSARGAQGVGKATTNAVVSSSILILCANYIITQLLFKQ
jgi:phospholipid/cholesterol/gamma-HCH transport system permease protein